MDFSALLDQIVADFMVRDLPTITSRRVRLPGFKGKADAVVGMRRSGKTWFLLQQVEDLAKREVPRSRCLYVNLEDERLAGMTAIDLQEIPEALFRRFPESRRQECWLLLDEVHNVAGWERFVRRLLDLGTVRVVVTGSSSRLLSREIATSLRGRSLTTEILPFSFAEVLDHGGTPVPRTWPPPGEDRSLLENRFRRHMEQGGFPEVQGILPDLRLRILQDYLDVALLRDVIERHGVTNTTALRWIVRRLLRSPAGRFSIHRLHNEMKSQGLRIGKDALHELVSHLEDAFLMFTVERHSRSEKQRQVNPKKYYLVDHALAFVRLDPRSFDTGHLLENIVYLELRRRGFSVDFLITERGHEVDFIANHPREGPRLVQVCSDLSEPETRSREVRAVEEAMSETGLDTAVIVTLAGETVIETARGRVPVVAAWRWLLEGTPPAVSAALPA